MTEHRNKAKNSLKSLNLNYLVVQFVNIDKKKKRKNNCYSVLSTYIKKLLRVNNYFNPTNYYRFYYNILY